MTDRETRYVLTCTPAVLLTANSFNRQLIASIALWAVELAVFVSGISMFNAMSSWICETAILFYFDLAHEAAAITLHLSATIALSVIINETRPYYVFTYVMCFTRYTRASL